MDHMTYSFLVSDHMDALGNKALQLHNLFELIKYHASSKQVTGIGYHDTPLLHARYQQRLKEYLNEKEAFGAFVDTNHVQNFMYLVVSQGEGFHSVDMVGPSFGVHSLTPQAFNYMYKFIEYIHYRAGNAALPQFMDPEISLPDDKIYAPVISLGPSLYIIRGNQGMPPEIMDQLIEEEKGNIVEDRIIEICNRSGYPRIYVNGAEGLYLSEEETFEALNLLNTGFLSKNIGIEFKYEGDTSSSIHNLINRLILSSNGLSSWEKPRHEPGAFF